MRVIGNNTYVSISSRLLGKSSSPITWSTIKSITWYGIKKVILHINRLQNAKHRVSKSTKDLKRQILSICVCVCVWEREREKEREREYTLVSCFDDPTSSSSSKSSLSWALWLLPRWPHTSSLLNFSFIAVKSKSSSNLVAEREICNPKGWLVKTQSPQRILATATLV
jgi:hypothetical protein